MVDGASLIFTVTCLGTDRCSLSGPSCSCLLPFRERSNNKLLDWSESGKPGAYLHVALMWHPLSAELVCDKLRSCGLRMQNLMSSFDCIHKDPERKR